MRKKHRRGYAQKVTVKTFTLDERTDELLDLIADREVTSRSEIIRRLVRKYVENELKKEVGDI